MTSGRIPALPPSRRSTIRLLGAAAAVAMAAAAPAARPPNILFILADDLGYGDLQCTGNPYLETPVLNRLAADGVLLTQHYAPSPLCAPSRAGFLTGRYNHRTGAIDVSSNRGIDRIALDELTFGDYFRHAGYATALIGKWHNGLYHAAYLPHNRGFDLFYGFPNGQMDYHRWHLQRNDTVEAHDGRYLSDALNDATIDFIRDHRDRPFAIFLAHHAPHVPLQAPDDLVAKYAARVAGEYGRGAAIVYAMIEAMDAGLGRVFRELDESGLRDNTVIVFTSDNGAHLGQSGPGGESLSRYDGGLSGNKGFVQEQGIRVPAIVSWPGRIPPGGSLATPVHGCDWLPTLYGLTGAEPPPGAKRLDGLDILPLLEGRTLAGLRDRPLPFQKNRYMPVAHSGAALRVGEWKLYWPATPETSAKDIARDNYSFARGCLLPHWEMPLDPALPDYAGVTTGSPRLYNLAADPAERHDRAAEFPAIVARLSTLYDGWFAEVFRDWGCAHRRILAQDAAHWQGREPPDPAALFRDFWQWRETGADPDTDNPLEVFTGYWNYREKEK